MSQSSGRHRASFNVFSEELLDARDLEEALETIHRLRKSSRNGIENPLPENGEINPREIRFSQGDMNIVTVISGKKAETFYGRYPFETLLGIQRLVQLHWRQDDLITVLVESPMGGKIYQYGNHGAYWVLHGKLNGYA